VPNLGKQASCIRRLNPQAGETVGPLRFGPGGGGDCWAKGLFFLSGSFFLRHSLDRDLRGGFKPGAFDGRRGYVVSKFRGTVFSEISRG